LRVIAEITKITIIYMQVFLDTQVLLNYLKGNSDEKAFPKLMILLNNKKINTLVTKQVVDEYIRNLANVKNECLKNIEAPYTINCNSLKTLNGEIKKARAAMHKRLIKIHEEKEKFKKREQNIKLYLNNPNIINDDSDILGKAQVRYLKGNPPRKRKERNDCNLKITIYLGQ